MPASGSYRLDPPVRLSIRYRDGPEFALVRRITVYDIDFNESDGRISLCAWCSVGRTRRFFSMDRVTDVIDDQGRSLPTNLLSAWLSTLVRQRRMQMACSADAVLAALLKYSCSSPAPDKALEEHLPLRRIS